MLWRHSPGSSAIFSVSFRHLLLADLLLHLPHDQLLSQWKHPLVSLPLQDSLLQNHFQDQHNSCLLRRLIESNYLIREYCILYLPSPVYLLPSDPVANLRLRRAQYLRVDRGRPPCHFLRLLPHRCPLHRTQQYVLSYPPTFCTCHCSIRLAPQKQIQGIVPY